MPFLKKVVVGEDEDAIAHLIEATLGDAGWLCLRGRNGEEALLKDLRKRFAFLGESSSVMFLFAVGEEMPQTLEKMHGAAQ